MIKAFGEGSCSGWLLPCRASCRGLGSRGSGTRSGVKVDRDKGWKTRVAGFSSGPSFVVPNTPILDGVQSAHARLGSEQPDFSPIPVSSSRSRSVPGILCTGTSGLTCLSLALPLAPVPASRRDQFCKREMLGAERLPCSLRQAGQETAGSRPKALQIRLFRNKQIAPIVSRMPKASAEYRPRTFSFLPLPFDFSYVHTAMRIREQKFYTRLARTYPIYSAPCETVPSMCPTETGVSRTGILWGRDLYVGDY